MRGNAFLQHVVIVIKHYTVLNSTHGVVLGHSKAEYDGQDKQCYLQLSSCTKRWMINELLD